MRLSVVLRHEDVRPETVAGACCVVIDVLRATTTLAAALGAGAAAVRVVASLDDARKAARACPGTLLAGERGGMKPDDFDLGNSPLEYTSEKVAGRRVVFSSTNGAKAVEAVLDGGGGTVCLAAIVNLSEAAGFLRRAEEEGKQAVLVCSGTEGGYSLEDCYCAGRLVSCLMAGGVELECDEGALTALAVFERFGLNALDALKASNHGRKLLGMGFGRDLEFAASRDLVPVLPVCSGGEFVNGV